MLLKIFYIQFQLIRNASSNPTSQLEVLLWSKQIFGLESFSSVSSAAVLIVMVFSLQLFDADFLNFCILVISSTSCRVMRRAAAFAAACILSPNCVCKDQSRLLASLLSFLKNILWALNKESLLLKPGTQCVFNP